MEIWLEILRIENDKVYQNRWEFWGGNWNPSILDKTICTQCIQYWNEA